MASKTAQLLILPRGSELSFWTVCAFVFALLSQAIFPMQAMAMPTADGGYVLCGMSSALDMDGEKDGKSAEAPNHCGTCIAVGFEAAEPPLLAQISAPYGLSAVAAFSLPPVSEHPARAPPRPHSCGPPLI